MIAVELDLFAHHPALARSTDPGTSRAAAASVSSNANRLEKIVLDAVKASVDGLTSHELAEATGLSLVTVSPRLRPLTNKGLIVDSQIRRAGTSGRQSIVWKPAQIP